jgi:hypothetical protein
MKNLKYAILSAVMALSLTGCNTAPLGTVESFMFLGVSENKPGWCQYRSASSGKISERPCPKKSEQRPLRNALRNL